MAIKVHYNPSTGKVSYNPVTGKVQVIGFPSCPYCNSPGPLKVTISDAVDFCCDFKIPPDAVTVYSQHLPGIAAVLNDTFCLNALGVCLWMYEEELAADTYYYYAYEGDDCSGTPSLTAEVTKIRITYQVVTTSKGRLTIEYWADDFLSWQKIEVYECTEIETNCIPKDALIATLVCPEGGDTLGDNPYIDSASVVVEVP